MRPTAYGRGYLTALSDPGMSDDRPAQGGAATEVPRPAGYPWCTRSCGAADRSASRPVRSLRLAEVRVVLADSASVANIRLSPMTDVPAPGTDTVCTATTISCHLEEATMEPSDNSGKARSPTTAPRQPQGGAAPVAADMAGDQPFGPHAAQILATEHWSLLATRS